MKSANSGKCPVCDGTGRIPVAEEEQRYKGITAGYDEKTDTFPCNNCGGQYQWGQPSGIVALRKDNGAPCVHDYSGVNLGRCYNGYTCKHCGDYYTIDSGD